MKQRDILRVENLKVWFSVKKGVFGRTVGHVKAVDGVSFGLRRGETLGVVGESGSGKTTIARVITGLQKPTGGTVTLDGRVGMVFQDPLGSLNPRMTVRATLEEAISSGPCVSRLKSKVLSGEDTRRETGDVGSLLKTVGLDETALDKYPHEFSGGQRQRICIARAIASKPDLLVCDEAVSALDLSIRAQVLDLLEDLKEKLGLSLLFITHDLGVVQHIADRLIVMNKGKLIEEGPCSQVLKFPRAEYTRRLMASVPRIGVKSLLLGFMMAVAGLAQALPVESPDGRVVCDFDTSAGVPTVTVRYANVAAGKMTVAVRGGSFAVASAKPVRTVSSSVKPVWGTAARYPENYRELEVALKDKAGRVRDGVTIRAYNEGVAVQASHRTELYGSSFRDHESSAITLPEGTVAWGISRTEGTFDREPRALAELDRAASWRMPFTMRLPGGIYASLIEANVQDYPRSYLKSGGWTLKPTFVLGGHERRGLVKTPWRALLLAPSAGGLIGRAYLAELLNDPCALADASWIKPGLCISDQGNCPLVQEKLVATAKAAKALGARYLQIDWGWYGTEVPWTEDDCAAYRNGRFGDTAAANPGWEENTKADPRTIARGHVPYHPTKPYGGRVGVDFDIPALVRELRALDMGLCLYVHGYVLENSDLDDLFALYESWGVAGLKPGFVCYGSQRATEWLRKLAEVSARHHLWLDIHDAHVPDGFERTWPHVMTTEGGGGQEGNHPVRQDVALPFTRCLAGPFDYTPKFFDAARTHAHAAAMLLAYPGPTAVLRGKIAIAAADPVAAFVKALPWTYDETRVLAGEISDHLVLARRKGATWYLAGLCGETPREITVDLSFLGPGAFSAEVTDDGGSRPRHAVSAEDKLTLSMKTGGGAYAVFAR